MRSFSPPTDLGSRNPSSQASHMTAETMVPHSVGSTHLQQEQSKYHSAFSLLLLLCVPNNELNTTINITTLLSMSSYYL